MTVRAMDAARNVAIFEKTFSLSDLVFPRHSVERKRHDCRLVGHIRGLELSPGKIYRKMCVMCILCLMSGGLNMMGKCLWLPGI